MHIGVLPYTMRNKFPLNEILLSDIAWMDENTPTGKCVADLQEDDHLVVYPSSTLIIKRFKHVRCKVDLLLAEPFAVHYKYYRLLWLLRYKFNIILCRYPKYAERYNNVVSFNAAETWIEPSQIPTDNFNSKSKKCSLIASDKRDFQGITTAP